MNSTTDQLIFNDIMNENSRDYTCRAIVSIPESGIENYYETSIPINTNSKAVITIVKSSGGSRQVSIVSVETPFWQT